MGLERDTDRPRRDGVRALLWVEPLGLRSSRGNDPGDGTGQDGMTRTIAQIWVRLKPSVS